MFIKVGMNNGEQCLQLFQGRKIKRGYYRRFGSRKITSTKQIWMVYSRIYVYTSESTQKINMGVFYGKCLGITIECSSVNHRKITWEYKNMLYSR